MRMGRGRIAVCVLAVAIVWGSAGDIARAQDNQPTGSTPLPGMQWLTKSYGTMTLEYLPADQAFLSVLERYLTTGRATVEAFFGKEFPKPFIVRVFPDRKTMTAYWRTEWGIPDLETECWMVASGTASTLSLLSPRAWAVDACEHDASDTVRTQLVITHELVHTFNGQFNPRPDFDGLDSLGWFLEGLAVFASGQLEGGYLADAGEAMKADMAPKSLFTAWSGKYRYGVSGSLVKYLDGLVGRKEIVKLLAATSTAQVLMAAGVSEPELLAGWRAWVEKGGGK